MTKRALSLLLTLVMVLSLCVPALAAEDGFVAEAPADVIEEAPAAPVEPEAPEAEEPAEEPVVDEPVAEEADAPEIAAVMEEEDLPYLVALGVVSKEAHWELEKAVKAAEEIMPEVEAGELYESNRADFNFQSAVWTNDTHVKKYLEDPVKNDPLKEATDEFMAAYETAKKYLDAIDGVIIDEDVTTSTVKNTAAKLAKYVVDTDNAYAANQLDDEAGSANNKGFTKANLFNFLKFANRTYTTNSTGMELGGIVASDLTIDNTITKVNSAKWKAAYHADYLEKLQAALDTVNAYNDKTATYKDFTTALKQVLDVIQAEAAGARPAASDMSALNSAINSAQSTKDNWNPATDDGAFVHGTTTTTLAADIGYANGLKNSYQGLNDFATKATYAAYNKAIDDINNHLVRKTNSIQYEANKLSGSDLRVTVTVKKVGGIANYASTGDGNEYGFSYKINDTWYASNYSGTPVGTEDVAEAGIVRLVNTDWAANDKYPDKLVRTFTLKHIGSTAIQVGDTVTLRFHETSSTTHPFIEFTFTVTDAYNGPVIKSVTYKPNDSSAEIHGYTPSFRSSLKGGYPNGITLSITGNGTPSAVEVELTDKIESATTYRLEVVNGYNDAAFESSVQSGAFKSLAKNDLTNKHNEYLIGGDMTASLKIYPNNDLSSNNYFIWDSETFKVEPLSAWTEVAVVKQILADVQTLKQENYKFVSYGRVDVTNLAAAFQTINSDVSKLNTMITDPTVANSDTNRATVASTLQEIINVCNCLQKKVPNTEALSKLMADAKDIIDEGEDSWTYDSWGALNDAYKAATAANPLTGKLQTEVDELAADLQAALNGMAKEGEVDKTALNAAIAAAEALVEADYTPESWAAAKTEIDTALAAAKTMAANDNATQAQVNTTLNALNTAVSKLVKAAGDEPEIPAAPKSGTGWVQNEKTGDIYFYQKGQLKKSFWVGKADGASAWDGNWYYVDADGKLATGMAYLDDLHGGFGWYYLQPTNKNGEIGKMLTGWQWVGGEYGTCYFSAKNGEAGKCTYSTLKGNWTGSGWEK